VKKPEPGTLPLEEARDFLVGHHGVRGQRLPKGAAGVRALLAQLRCIQLDPLDVIGTNADLVALARVDGIARGDVYRHLLPGHAFEHFAKERCLLPAAAFPYYRDHAAEAPWWRLSVRLQRLPPGVVEKVLEEVRARGPISAAELTHHGHVEALDWSGWKGTGRATSMALEVLWTRCQIVVCGRGPKGKLYDAPERALPQVARAPSGDFHRWALLERVEAAGLLARASGAIWSMLWETRTSPLPDQLVAEGLIEEVRLPGSPRTYLAPRGFRDRRHGRADDRMRILGPLDPLLWDRELVRRAFGFDYVWEVYKPLKLRRWGWYVVPLLQRGQLVGRLEASVQKHSLRVKKVWPEPGRALDRDALVAALERHALACGAQKLKLPRGF
jgi:uncharacterized protein YcaQ